MYDLEAPDRPPAAQPPATSPLAPTTPAATSEAAATAAADARVAPVALAAVAVDPIPAISIIVPARDEAASLPALVEEIAAVMAGEAFEIIVVDDGSADDTAAVLAAIGRRAPWLRLLRHASGAGKSAAIRSGALAARGAILVTIDGDGQNDPRFLPALIAPLASDPRIALVAGQRTTRHDGVLKARASRFANRLRQRLLGDGTRDTACGLKAIRREVYLRLPFFDNNHRFLPALVLREGLAIDHVDVADRPRRHGRSKYGVLDRMLVGLPDLLGVWWLRRRRREVPAAEERQLR